MSASKFNIEPNGRLFDINPEKRPRVTAVCSPRNVVDSCPIAAKACACDGQLQLGFGMNFPSEGRRAWISADPPGPTPGTLKENVWSAKRLYDMMPHYFGAQHSRRAG